VRYVHVDCIRRATASRSWQSTTLSTHPGAAIRRCRGRLRAVRDQDPGRSACLAERQARDSSRRSLPSASASAGLRMRNRGHLRRRREPRQAAPLIEPAPPSEDVRERAHCHSAPDRTRVGCETIVLVATKRRQVGLLQRLTGTYVDVSNFPGTPYRHARRPEEHDVTDTPGVLRCVVVSTRGGVARDISCPATSRERRRRRASERDLS